METGENIFMEQFNKYKNYIYSFLYFFMFLFTLFVSFLIIFQQLHKDNINFIYFYLTFCVGLFFLLGLLIFRQDLLSLIIFFVYFFYSLFFLFLILRFDYSIYLKSIPIFFMIIILSILALILMGIICNVNNSLLTYIIINFFSLFFVGYYFYSNLNDIPTISTEDTYSYVSFYKLYVFIMCIYYFFIYINEMINKTDNAFEIKSFTYPFLFLMILGLFLYIIRINGKTSISLQAFLIMEYIPLFLFGLFIIVLICLFIFSLFFRSSISYNYDYVRNLVIISLCFNIISVFISWFVYSYNSKPRLLSINQMVIWNFCSIFLIIICSLLINNLSLLASISFILMLFLLGAVLFFCKFINFSVVKIYYLIYFLAIIVFVVLGFIYKNQINPDLVYGNELVHISWWTVFKIGFMLIILITLLTFANLSYKTVENALIMFVLCILPVILFYLFYVSNKKATNSNFLISCIRMIGDIISSFFKNMFKVSIFLIIIVLATICLSNLISNKYSSIDIYFLAYFFFLILYIVYYFSDFLKGNFESENFVRKVSLINLLLFFSGLVIYYLLYGLGYISKGVGSVSNQNSYSQIIFYLILFVFLAFVYVYYRNNLAGSTNPYINLFVNIILYIPCLFVYVIEYIQSQMKEKSSPYFIILMIEIVLVLLYGLTIFLQTRYITQGGNSLIREPVDLNINTSLTVPGAFQTSINKPFALSFWFYINSQSMTTNKYYNLLNYQFRPQVLYNPKLNTLLIDISGNNWETSYLNTYNIKNPSLLPENSVDTSGNETILDENLQTTGIIYINNKIPLQKWNHLAINYNGDIMDIFLNGKLVKSSSQVVPNVQTLLFDVGQNNGIDGGICNLMFYAHVLSYSSVVTLYQSVKDISPPIPTVYWDSQKKKVQFSKLDNLKEQYKLNKILNI